MLEPWFGLKEIRRNRTMGMMLLEQDPTQLVSQLGKIKSPKNYLFLRSNDKGRFTQCNPRRVQVSNLSSQQNLAASVAWFWL